MLVMLEVVLRRRCIVRDSELVRKVCGEIGSVIGHLMRVDDFDSYKVILEVETVDFVFLTIIGAGIDIWKRRSYF